MPVGLVRKLTVAAIIAAAIGVVACKDDDEDPPVVPHDGGSPGGMAGGMDAAVDSGGGTGGGDAAVDAARDTGPAAPMYEAGAPCMGWDGGPVQCGTKQCFWHRTPLTCANPGCINADASICGIDTNTLGGVDAGLPALLPYEAPGVDAPECATLIDSFEAADAGPPDSGSKGNGKIDSTRVIMNLTVYLRYPGCCTPAGFCTVNTGKGEGMLMGTGMWNPSNSGYGCLSNRIAFAANPPAQSIYCNATTGALIDGGAGPGSSGDGGSGDGGGGDGGGGDAGADGGGDGGDGG
jgi:hypothetical protein